MSLCNFRIIICTLTPDGYLLTSSTVIPLVISCRLQAKFLLIRYSTMWVSDCVLLYWSCRTFTCPSIDVASSPTALFSLCRDKNKTDRILLLEMHRNFAAENYWPKMAFSLKKCQKYELNIYAGFTLRLAAITERCDAPLNILLHKSVFRLCTAYAQSPTK